MYAPAPTTTHNKTYVSRTTMRLTASIERISRLRTLDMSQDQIIYSVEALYEAQKEKVIDVIESDGIFFTDLFKSFRTFFYKLIEIVKNNPEMTVKVIIATLKEVGGYSMCQIM